MTGPQRIESIVVINAAVPVAREIETSKIVITATHGISSENMQVEYLKGESTEPAAGKSDAKEPKRAQQVDEIRPGKIPAPVSPQGHGPDR